MVVLCRAVAVVAVVKKVGVATGSEFGEVVIEDNKAVGDMINITKVVTKIII